MKNLIIFFFIILSTVISAQQELIHLTEMQKIFFVAEASGLGSTSNNPASIAIRSDNSGVLVGYDFNEFSTQGNVSGIITFDNFGFSYQDVYNINNVRLQNYSVNLSYGNEVLSVGSTNRYTVASYSSYRLNQFSFDVGIIFKPLDFLSFGLLGKNLSETKFDSIAYPRSYTAGVGLTLFDNTFCLYADADFKDNYKFRDATTTFGIVIVPLNILEFRAGAILNPDDLITINNRAAQIIEIKYEAFISAGFLINNAIRVTAAVKFNDKGEKSRFAAVVGFPF